MMLNSPQQPSKAQYAAALKVLHERIRECFGWEPHQYNDMEIRATVCGDVTPIIAYVPLIVRELINGATLVLKGNAFESVPSFLIIRRKKSEK